MKPEQALQRQCFQTFKQFYPKRLFIHIPNERKSKMEVIWLNAQGTLKGCPDILIPEPIMVVQDEGKEAVCYAGLWIELKCGKNKPSDSQVTVMEALRQRGHAVAVCYSLTEFMNTVKTYFAGKWVNQ